MNKKIVVYYENTLAERMNGILKNEYLLDRTFKDFVHAERSFNEAITLYNTRRPHLSLGYKTPEQVHHAGKHCTSKSYCFNLENNAQNIETVEVKTIAF